MASTKGHEAKTKMARVNHKNGGGGFVLCVENESNPESLEILKVYRTLPDAEAERDKWIRVIDESGEDYLYPKSYFVSVEISASARKRIAEVVERIDVATQR
jgi:hypothetical protein